MAGDMTRTDVFKYQKIDVDKEVIIVFAVVFIVMLACVAGVRKGKGKGDFGREIPFPFRFRTPVTQAIIIYVKLVVL